MNGIVILFIVVIIAGAACYVVFNVARAVSNAASTIVLLKEGLAAQENEIETSPKSINGMTSLCIPRITKDFPEFNWHEFKQKSENMRQII